MTQERLRELLSRLREHVSASESVDPESRRQLGGVTRDIEHALGRSVADRRDVADATAGRAAGAAPRLEALAVRFEAGHPALAETLREIIDALVKAGI